MPYDRALRRANNSAAADASSERNPAPVADGNARANAGANTQPVMMTR